MKKCPPCHGECDQGRRCPAVLSNKLIFLAIGIALLIFWHAVAYLIYWSMT